MAQAFRSLPNTSTYIAVTATPGSVTPPGMIACSGTGSGNEEAILPYNTVRVTNLSAVGLVVNVTGATATSTSCDGAVAANSWQDFFVAPNNNSQISLATLAGSTQAIVCFGNTTK